MKILVYGGGLGNQIFGYAFTEYIRNKYPDQKVYGVYNESYLSEHYGLEINRWFDVKLPVSTWYSTLAVAFAVIMKRFFSITRFIDNSQRECENEDAIAFLAFKYTKKYIPQEDNWLKWKSSSIQLNEKNQSILELINHSNSWFVHVRRGDFLSERYKKDYEGCCPLSYYQEAIADVLRKEENPIFFGFSDDIQWAMENLPNVDIHFIDWNTGTDSPLDMYLMSQCNGAIIANSTFSYWGALLGRKKKRTYYPKKWVADPTMHPDIFPGDWISY